MSPTLKHPRNTHAMAVLACPRCHATLESDAGQLRCVDCGRAFTGANGIFDFAPEIDLQPGLAQWFMEHRLITGIYEERFRPALTGLVSRLRYADEESYLERWLSAASGPVLDLACGTGRYSRWLARRLGAGRILGLDLSRSMLAQARQRALADGLGEIVYARASALSLPIHDRSLGAVHSFGALHLFPDVGQALREVGRVLEPGGSFTCLTTGWSGAPLRRSAQAAFSRLATLRFFAVDELRVLLGQAGLEPLDFSAHGLMLLFAARKA